MEIERGLVRTSVGYIHYRATGQGKPIILMHATPKSSAMFLELMPVLGKELRVFAIDTPSYGMSDHIVGKTSISDYSKVVSEVMDGLGLTKASFLGEATGAYIAVDIASRYPERTEKIVLVSCPFWRTKEFNIERHVPYKKLYRYDSTGFPQPRTVEEVIKTDPEHIPLKPTQSWLDRDNVALIESGRDVWQALDAIDEYDFRSNIERLQCPVLLIWGEHFFYLQFRDEVTSRIKNHQVVIIKGGRFVLPVEYPEEVGKATMKFLGVG